MPCRLGSQAQRSHPSPTFCVDCNGVHLRGDGCLILVAFCSLTPLYVVANPSPRGYEKRSIAHDLVMRPSFRDVYIPQKLFFYGSPPELKVRGLVVAGQCFISARRTMLNLSLLDSLAHRCPANRGARGPRYDERGHEPTTNLGGQNSPKIADWKRLGPYRHRFADNDTSKRIHILHDPAKQIDIMR